MVIDLLHWWNLVFLLPLLLGLLYLLLQAFTGAPEHDGEATADHAPDGDAGHAGHAAEHGEASGGEGHDADSEQDAGLAWKAMAFLGFGRVPLSILLTTFCLVWGFSGWISNQALGDVVGFPGPGIGVSLAIALVSSAMLTRYLARGLSRLLPMTETYGLTRRDLVGKSAVVRFAVTTEFGRAWLHDSRGVLHEVSCRVKSGEPDIPPGRRVVLYEFDVDKEVFIVFPDPTQGSALPQLPE
ncbi:MAG: DUF1449 family protein [Chloroflexi bacterium]|nr:DUF1449 family protein [Chloroflexota bacterium]